MDIDVMADIAPQQTEQAGGDASLLVKFVRDTMPDKAKTLEEGRPISKMVDFISIRVPGDKLSSIYRPVREKDKQRFPEHWRRYQARQDQDDVDGVLLEDWPGVTTAQVEELRYFNVRTLEQLVSMSDGNAQGMMGINGLKERARAYLEASETQAAAEKALAADKEIAELKAQVAELMKDKPKRGRPPKEVKDAEAVDS